MFNHVCHDFFDAFRVISRPKAMFSKHFRAVRHRMWHATGSRLPVHREDLVSLEDASHLRLRTAGLEALGAEASLTARLLRCSGPSQYIYMQRFHMRIMATLK